MLNEASISEFRRVSKIHEDWLVRAIVGPDLLTKGELESLELHPLPSNPVLDLTTVSYLLGKKVTHLKADEYKSLTHDDLTSHISELELASISDLRLRAASEVRKIAQYVSSTFQVKLQSCLTKGIQSSIHGADLELCVQDHLSLLTGTVFGKAFTLFENVYNMAILDLVHVSKSTAQINSMVQGEGIYTEGIDSQLMVERAGRLTPVTAGDLMSKSLSGMNLHYVPPGGEFSEGKIHIVDQDKFAESLSKAVAGVSGGIASTVKPTGPPKSKTPSSGTASIPGLAAPGNQPGPGAPGGKEMGGGKSSDDYDQWLSPGTPKPEGQGWEQTKSGGWRHLKGASSKGPKDPETVQQKTAQDQMDAQHYGRQPHKPSEVMEHLSNGPISALKQLGEEGSGVEAGINVANRVTIEGNGRGLMKAAEKKYDIDDSMIVGEGDNVKSISHSDLLGSGFGSVIQGQEHQSEVAAHHLTTMLGSDMVPPTTLRSYAGETNSIQAWSEGHESTGAWLEKNASDEDWNDQNWTGIVLKLVPEEHREAFTEKLNGLVVHDIIMNNNDRHANNLVINKEGSDFKAIDHGLAFGTGMKGNHNDFHQDLAQLGKPVTIPKTLQTKLRNTSLGDYQRAIGKHVQDWQVGQTYLRGRYALHLQDTEGHLDSAKFLPTLSKLNGTDEIPRQSAATQEGAHPVLHSGWQVNNSSREGMNEFYRRQTEKTLPDDLFNSWAKKFINDNRDNPESADHAVANQLHGIGVFMPAGGTIDPKSFRRHDAHRDFEATISARNPDAKVGHRQPQMSGPGTVDPHAATVRPERRAAGVDRRKEAGTLEPKAARELQERRNQPRGRRKGD